MNIIIPIILFVIAGLFDKINYGEYSIGIFALATAVATYYYKRVRLANQIEQSESVLNNLNQAIYNASYQAKMTKFCLNWYLLGVAVLTISNLILENTNIWFVIFIALTFVIAWIVGRWEQRCLHDKKRDELIDLKQKLIE